MAALLRGDRELNEERFRALLGAAKLEMATPEQVELATGAPVGFSGPVGLTIPRYGDEEVRGMVNFIAGGNAADTHVVDANWSDVAGEITWAHLRFAVAGDHCPRCAASLEERHGIELGHIFKQRDVISTPMHATFTDENGTERPFLMGCYGIGVSRLLAAVAEVHHDDNGLAWPASIAPFQVHLLAVNAANETQRALADRLYDHLTAAGIDVLYDDRPERAGSKFKDADLIGVPVQVVVGTLAGEGRVEIRRRIAMEKQVVDADTLPAEVRSRLEVS